MARNTTASYVVAPILALLWLMNYMAAAVAGMPPPPTAQELAAENWQHFLERRPHPRRGHGYALSLDKLWAADLARIGGAALLAQLTPHLLARNFNTDADSTRTFVSWVYLAKHPHATPRRQRIQDAFTAWLASYPPQFSFGLTEFLQQESLVMAFREERTPPVHPLVDIIAGGLFDEQQLTIFEQLLEAAPPASHLGQVKRYGMLVCKSLRDYAAAQAAAAAAAAAHAEVVAAEAAEEAAQAAA